MKKRIFLLPLIMATTWLMYDFFWGEQGLRKSVALKNEILHIQDENEKILIENKKLKKQIREIKDDPQKMDKILRRFFIIKKNEIFVMPYKKQPDEDK